MVMVSDFELKIKGDFVIVMSGEEAHCPFCLGILKYFSTVNRSVTSSDGKTEKYQVSVLKCPVCAAAPDGHQKYHRMLPDCILPYKHYDAETIQGAIDRSAEACPAENSTIARWRSSYKAAEPDIEMRLEAERCRDAGTVPPLVGSHSLLLSIRAAFAAWLAYVIKLLVNAGQHIFNGFAFSPRSASVTMSPETKNTSNGGDSS